MKRKLVGAGLFLLLLLFNISCTQNPVIVCGSFSETGEAGLKVFEFRSSTGELTQKSSFNGGINPSYLCFSAKHQLLYSINEVDSFRGEKAGGITTIGFEGKLSGLRLINEFPVPCGGPCYISASPDNKFLLVANYGSGSVALVRLDEKGIPELTTDTIIYNDIPGRRSHAHMIDFNPAGNEVFVTDLGYDRIMRYKINSLTGKFEPGGRSLELSPGSGPRHFAFNSKGTGLYVMGELNSKISVFIKVEDNELNLVQTISSLRDTDTIPDYSADIHLSPSGNFLYASNRGENTIAVFRILEDGKLELSGHSESGGDWPRNFTLDRSGRFLLVANQRSDNISVFEIDAGTGIPGREVQNVNTKAPSVLKLR